MQTDRYVGTTVPAERSVSEDDSARCPVRRLATSPVPMKEGRLPAAGRRTDQLAREAVEFLIAFFAERQPHANLRARVSEVVSEIELTGTYRHTEAELQFG